MRISLLCRRRRKKEIQDSPGRMAATSATRLRTTARVVARTTSVVLAVHRTADKEVPTLPEARSPPEESTRRGRTAIARRLSASLSRSSAILSALALFFTAFPRQIRNRQESPAQGTRTHFSLQADVHEILFLSAILHFRRTRGINLKKKGKKRRGRATRANASSVHGSCVTTCTRSQSSGD